MPFIETKTSKEISLDAEAKMRRELGSAIEMLGSLFRWLSDNNRGCRGDSCTNKSR